MRTRTKVATGVSVGAASLGIAGAAFAAWALSATITTNVTKTAESIEIDGSSCTASSAAVVRPGDLVATCVFNNIGNAPGANVATNYAVTTQGANVTSPDPGVLAFDQVNPANFRVTVPVYAGSAGTDASLTSVTLSFTPPPS